MSWPFGEPPADAGRMADLFGCDARAGPVVPADRPHRGRHPCPRAGDRPSSRVVPQLSGAAGRADRRRARGGAWRVPAPAGARRHGGARRRPAWVRRCARSSGRPRCRSDAPPRSSRRFPKASCRAPFPFPRERSAGSTRHRPPATAPGLGQEVQFALADSGLWVELRLEPQSDELVAIALRVSGSETTDVSVQLRAVEAERAELVARYTVRGSAPVLVKGVRPGRYVLELHERERTLRFKLRFDVELAA